MSSPDAMLSLEAVAAEFNVDKRTIKRLCARGLLRSKKIGTLFRFKRAWLDEFLEGSKTAPPATWSWPPQPRKRR